MTISEFIKALKKDNLTQKAIANTLGVSCQNMANKTKRGTFNISELYAIGNLVDMKLAFVPKEIISEEMILITPMESDKEK